MKKVCISIKSGKKNEAGWCIDISTKQYKEIEKMLNSFAGLSKIKK